MNPSSLRQPNDDHATSRWRVAIGCMRRKIVAHQTPLSQPRVSENAATVGSAKLSISWPITPFVLLPNLKRENRPTLALRASCGHCHELEAPIEQVAQHT